MIAVESIPKRKGLARHFGADVVIDFREQDPVRAILNETKGRRVDSAVEALGAQTTFAACLRVNPLEGLVMGTRSGDVDPSLYQGHSWLDALWSHREAN